MISSCIQSLDKAARIIAQNKSRIDCYLFMIKHLLIIRDQIAPFKIECTVREVSIDFQRFKGIYVIKLSYHLLIYLFFFYFFYKL